VCVCDVGPRSGVYCRPVQYQVPAVSTRGVGRESDCTAVHVTVTLHASLRVVRDVDRRARLALLGGVHAAFHSRS